MPSQVSPEDEAGFLSILLYSWLTPLIKAGRDHPLQTSDLYPLAKGTASGELGDRFEVAYNNVVSRSEESFLSRIRWRGSTTLMALMKILGWGYWVNVVTKMIWLGFRIAQVYLLRAIVTYVQEKGDGNSTRSVWFYIALSLLLFVATLGQGLFLTLHHYYAPKYALKAQTAIAVAVYRKALRISLEALNSSPTMQGRIGNLIMNDTERLYQAFKAWHVLWFGVVEVTVVAGLISVELGLSGLFCFPFLVLTIATLWVFAGMVGRSRKKAMGCADLRVQTMSNVLHDMRSVKLNAWEPYFLGKISGERRQETRYLFFANFYDAINKALARVASLLLPLILFACYSLLFGNVLTAPAVFASVALINIFSAKMLAFPKVFRFLAEAAISLSRLDSYFELSEKSSNLLSHPHDTNDDENTEASSEDVLVQKLDSAIYSPVRLRIIRGDFAWNSRQSTAGTSGTAELNLGVSSCSPNHSPHACNEEYLFNRDVALNEVDLEINAKDLVSIVGPVGSGKSSLLLAILGELHLVRGSIQTFGTVAYCAQQPWIMNGTVRENITLFASSERDFDKEMYDRIVEACCLTNEICHLPAGDLTEIGERGVNLSGGQKARLALARAIYADCDIYLLDDPLSAVDSAVGNHLKNRVFGPLGILSSKARLIVTHQLQLLPLSGCIHIVKAGVIIASGTLKQLEAKGHKYSDLGISDDCHDIDSAEKTRSVEEQRSTNVKEIAFGEGSNSSCEKLNEALASSTTRGRDSLDSENSRTYDGHLTVKEDRCMGKVSWGTYWKYMEASGGIPAVFSVLAAYSVTQGTLLAGSWWLARWSTDGFDRIEKSNQYAGNLFYVLGLIGFTVAFGAFSLVHAGLVVDRVMAASRRLHDQLLNRVMRATPLFFQSNPTGRILNRFSRDVDDLDSLLPPAVQLLLEISFISLGAIVIICWILPWFLIALVPIALIVWYIQHRFVSSSRELKRLDSISKSPPYALYSEMLTGLLTLRAHSAEKHFMEKFQDRLDKSVQASWQFRVSVNWILARLDILTSIVVLFTSLIVVIISGRLDPGLAGVALSQSIVFANDFQLGAIAKTDCENVFTSAERICTMAIDTPVEAPAIVEGAELDPHWPSQGVVEFENVELRYRPHLDPALRNLSFKTKPFERIGVCGRTAAGKSSIFVALFRMVELWGGRILIDDIDVSKIGLRDLRTSAGIVPQDPTLFNATLRENIDPLGSHSDAELWVALDLMHMGASIRKAEHENLRCGLDQIVRDGGQNFSSGERQLVCLTRVLLSDVHIVVLDEATASVDDRTDMIIQETMRKYLNDRTVITIAHRLGTIIDCDRILVMESGAAVEFGTPRELLESDGYFTEMVRLTGNVESAKMKRQILACSD